jgi:hypothetical protein
MAAFSLPDYGRGFLIVATAKCHFVGLLSTISEIFRLT